MMDFTQDERNMMMQKTAQVSVPSALDRFDFLR